MEVDGSEGVHNCVVEKLQEFPLSANQYFPFIDLTLPDVPDVVGVLTEEDVHDGGDQHVDEDEDDEGVELAGTPVQGKQLSSGQVRNDNWVVALLT